MLALVALGAWLYQSSLFPQDRQLVWRLDSSGEAITQLELQLWNPQNELLKREVQAFPHGAPAQLEQKVSLSEGRYEARYVIDRAGGGQEAGKRTLEVGGERTYHLTLGRR
ncbi:MAG: hypothetical protein M3Y59_05245 [Myxococcota bacterium]|nr:hypothetical protein [Myxococcota bacterium]